MTRIAGAATLWLLAASLVLAGESLTVEVADQPQELDVGELLERYAKPNHLELRVDPQVAQLKLRFLETCTLDRGGLSALLRSHGVSLASSGARLFASSADRTQRWPAIPRVIGPETQVEQPTELVTVVLPLDGDERLGASLQAAHQADQHRDVALTWLPSQVILTGPAERVRYYLRLAEELGTPRTVTVQTKLVQVQFAKARDVAHHLLGMLSTVEGEQPPFRPRPTVTADERTNQVLLRGPAAWLLTAEQVIRGVDVRIAPPPGPTLARVDVALYVLSADDWQRLSADARAAEILERLDAGVGEGSVQRPWHTARWVLGHDERATLSQQTSSGSLLHLGLSARLVPEGIQAQLEAGFVEGEARSTIRFAGVLRPEAGVAVQATSLDPQRVVVFTTRGGR